MGGSLRFGLFSLSSAFLRPRISRPVFGGEIIGAHIGATTPGHAPLIGIRIAGFAIIADLPCGAVSGGNAFVEFVGFVIAHALEEIIGLVVLAHMRDAEVKIFALASTPFWGKVRRRIFTFGPFAGGFDLCFWLTAFFAFGSDTVEIF